MKPRQESGQKGCLQCWGNNKQLTVDYLSMRAGAILPWQTTFSVAKENSVELGNDRKYQHFSCWLQNSPITSRQG